MSRRVRVIVLGAVFVATVVATGVLVWRIPGGIGPILALAGRLAPSDWALVGIGAAVFYLLDYLRFYAVLRLLGMRLGLATGVELTCVSYFVSSLTPTADLHLPAMVFILSRRGLSPSRAAAASITKSIYQVTWICVIALGALAVAGDVHLPVAAKASLLGAAVPLAALVGLFAILIAFPAPVRRLAAARRGRFWAGLGALADNLAALGRSGDRMHLVVHAASIAFIFTYVAIGFFLCRGLGVELGLARAVPVFATSLMVAYLAPVPGSIGVTEIVTSYLIDPALPPPALAAAILLRAICWYGVVVPGAILLAEEARRAARA
jgi:uncharacterized membrane protein YbhN (UPF0104 family)